MPSAIFLYAMLAFLAGVGVESFLARSFWFLIIAVACAGFLAGIIAYGKKNYVVALAGFLIVVCAIGMARMALVRAPAIADEWKDRSVEVSAEISAISDWGLDAIRIDVDTTYINQQPLAKMLAVRIRTNRYPEYAIGDELLVRGVLKSPLRPHDPFYLSYPAIERVRESESFTAARVFGRVRNVLNERIEAIMPEPHASLLKGLLLGEKQSLPKDFTEELKRSGTSHIVALSGYNITIVGRSFMALLLMVTMPFMASFWLAVIAIFGFVLLTGASASLVRAGIMGILALVAEREGRMYRMTNALIFAGAVMVMHDPTILRFDVSFQLSFLATLGLVVAAPVYARAMHRVMQIVRSYQKITRVPRDNEEKSSGFKTILIETLAAQTMVTPLLLYHFGTFSLVSPFANLVVLISIPYAMGIGFGGVAISFVSDGLGRVVGYVAWALLEYQMRAISFFAAFSFAAVDIPGFSEGMLVVSYITLAVLLWRWKKKGNAVSL